MPDLAAWRGRINACLNNEGPHMVYQPIFGLEPFKLVGYEALSRFPDGVGPDQWFAAAKEVGLDYELELMAVLAALKSADSIGPDIYMAVNVSPSTVLNPGFADAVGEYDLTKVVFEITEHHPVDDYNELKVALCDLRGEGAVICTPVGPVSTPSSPRVSVDDLGAGFASMRHVLALEPDFMKLDTALVQGIDHSLPQRALVAALVTFGFRLGVRVVAEGIETETECATVRALDVHSGQGYLLGKPAALPAPDR